MINQRKNRGEKENGKPGRTVKTGKKSEVLGFWDSQPGKKKNE